jgi:hypothetical protein
MIMMLQRTIIYLIITLACLGFLYAVENKPPLIPHGIYLPATTHTFAPTPGAITLVKIPPLGAQKIGIINMQMRLSGEPSEIQEHQVLESASVMAKQNGADGIALNYFFASQAEGNKSYLLQAMAFKV